MVTNQFKTFKISINLNAHHVNGMTHFDLAGHSGLLVKIHVHCLYSYKTLRIFFRKIQNSILPNT